MACGRVELETRYIKPWPGCRLASIIFCLAACYFKSKSTMVWKDYKHSSMSVPARLKFTFTSGPGSMRHVFSNQNPQSISYRIVTLAPGWLLPCNPVLEVSFRKPSTPSFMCILWNRSCKAANFVCTGHMRNIRKSFRTRILALPPPSACMAVYIPHLPSLLSSCLHIQLQLVF